ncbi:MAG: aryl-sulfate sulfotransferase [Deltaproteobacteria bacterium]|nr:aryl-sulfate sulfotransferase [Deltaproteobacteria bacterium]
MAFPSVFPTGTTIYDPDKCWNGYTVFQAREAGAAIIDMNGQVLQIWQGLQGFPNKLLPGGYVMGSTGLRSSKHGYQDQTDLVQVDWEGKIIWRFDHHELIKDPGQDPRWMARQHHDYQREGNPVGYFVPGMEPKPLEGNTIVLCHRNLYNTEISDKLLLDDVFLELDWEGNIIWEWVCSRHFDEFEFSEAARNTMARNPNFLDIGVGFGDWMHINSMSFLGKNKWYESGDDRFHPDNIIFSGRQTNIIAIIERKSGKVVWKIGPDYDIRRELRDIGWIIGPHHAHIIPKGLPGEGNLMIFDNGGFAGYGVPNPGSSSGLNYALRDYSRVLEIDPISLKVIWQYSPAEADCAPPSNSYLFYSPLVSSAQRLPNGNTMITVGCGGIMIEVTPKHELVWEYISPYYAANRNTNLVYRAYRVPYDWVPQLKKPEESPVERLVVSEYSLNGRPPKEVARFTAIEGIASSETDSQFCVLEDKNQTERDK